MQELRDKVAVITGGASGMGFAFAKRCADEGMKVVLADVEEGALSAAVKELESQEARVLAVQGDVSKAEDIDALAKRALDEFGAVHVLFNNAGVIVDGLIWEQSLADWEWVMGVNVMGVVHGIRTFVPIMLEQDTECHIINTASMAGMVGGPGLGNYRVSKFGVVALSETLHFELSRMDSKIKVSVLCPGLVNTRIFEAGRNRPEALKDTRASTKGEEIFQHLTDTVPDAMPPEQVAERIMEAVKGEKFYILPHEVSKERIRTRLDDILNDRLPTPPVYG